MRQYFACPASVRQQSLCFWCEIVHCCRAGAPERRICRQSHRHAVHASPGSDTPFDRRHSALSSLLHRTSSASARPPDCLRNEIPSGWTACTRRLSTTKEPSHAAVLQRLDDFVRLAGESWMSSASSLDSSIFSVLAIFITRVAARCTPPCAPWAFSTRRPPPRFRRGLSGSGSTFDAARPRGTSCLNSHESEINRSSLGLVAMFVRFRGTKTCVERGQTTSRTGSSCSMGCFRATQPHIRTGLSPSTGSANRSRVLPPVARVRSKSFQS